MPIISSNNACVFITRGLSFQVTLPATIDHHSRSATACFYGDHLEHIRVDVADREQRRVTFAVLILRMIWAAQIRPKLVGHSVET